MRDHLRGGFFRTPRTVRLEKDFEQMKALAADSTIFSFEAADQPPDHYRIFFKGKTLVPVGPDGITVGREQACEIKMGIDYPRGQPMLRWLTPIVHPNIFGNTVCLGTFWASWTPYYKLTDLVEVLWDMARLAILNPHSGGPGGRNERSLWEERDAEFGFPVDKRPLRDRRFGPGEGNSIIRETGQAGDVLWLDEDPSCPKGGSQ